MKYCIEDYIGKVYGDREVIGNGGKDGYGHCMVICRCKCGKESKVMLSKLLCGKQLGCKSCHSFLLVHGGKKRGMGMIRLYEVWQHMKQRCINSRVVQYSDYGGRGIKVCNEWKDDFVAFRDWALGNGYRDDLTIDRIDVDGDYEPSNCRWVSREIQVINRRIQKSNKSGYEGIDYEKRLGKWKVRISMDKKREYLGVFDTLEEAINTRNRYIIDRGLPHKIQEYKGE